MTRRLHHSVIKFLVICRKQYHHHIHHIRFWYLWCCGCPGLRGRQHLATPQHHMQMQYSLNYSCWQV